MRYISTRGAAPVLDFKGALLAGLASDGGLYVPESIPQVTPQQLSSWAGLSYPELAVEVMLPFVGDSFTRAELTRMVGTAYANFRHPAVAPLTQLSHDHFLLELFHGPTLAFKDFALQLLGLLLEAALKGEKKRPLILGATSGDTGSAAIAGCAGRNIDIIILYPHGRTSDVQRRQMTSITDPNVHAIAIEGTFDDCQALVKQAFGDTKLREQVHLLAVNSINWARVLAQVVYYFYAALALGAPARRVNFTVPTGNFGDIFAGYIAQQMGLPMGKLIIASNKNDILPRALSTGVYAQKGVSASLSPSMDIDISSNFERLLFDLHERDGTLLAQKMELFRSSKSLALDAAQQADFRVLFAAHSTDDAGTLAQIKKTYEATGMLLDPHTAVGVAATEKLKPEGITVTLATAHAAKFPDAVREATGITPPLPAHLADLHERPERILRMGNAAHELNAFIGKL